MSNCKWGEMCGSGSAIANSSVVAMGSAMPSPHFDAMMAANRAVADMALADGGDHIVGNLPFTRGTGGRGV